jgi:hypothetical protein
MHIDIIDYFFLGLIIEIIMISYLAAVSTDKK